MTGPALDIADRFDAAAAWAALPGDVRAAIGIAVLSRHVAGLVIERAVEDDDPLRERVGLAADTAADRELDALLDEVAIAEVDTPAGRPRVPALLGMICEVCGCSDMDPCPQGCGWARDDLCTACADGHPAAAAAA